MADTRRAELSRRYLTNLCNALNRYVEEGGTIHVMTTHGDEPTDNQITLTLPDWEAFRAVLEPGTQLGES